MEMQIESEKNDMTNIKLIQKINYGKRYSVPWNTSEKYIYVLKRHLNNYSVLKEPIVNY